MKPSRTDVGFTSPSRCAPSGSRIAEQIFPIRTVIPSGFLSHGTEIPCEFVCHGIPIPSKRFQMMADEQEFSGVSQNRRRVLISAYAVSPLRGSEPGVGWNICVHLAAHHDVTVLCSPGEPPRTLVLRDEIAEHLRQCGPVPGLTFCFVDAPLLGYLFQRESLLMRRTLYYLGYRAWQMEAFRAAVRLHRERPFDVAHQLNITGFREPGYLWKLPLPFVWGPVGGAANTPTSFLAMMGWREQAFYCARNVLNSIQKRMLNRCSRAARRAGHIWTIGAEDRFLVERVWGCEAEQMTETGTSINPAVRPKQRDQPGPLRVAWSGRHIGRKLLPILLHALERLAARDAPGVELVVFGEGPETARWKALAERLGLAAHTHWTGWLPRRDAMAALASADVLAFTGVQEGTPHVVLEALSLGLPVICHDACGMGAAVTSACGVKVPLLNPQASIEGFALAVRSLATDAGEFARLSAGALQRANELSWTSKARHIAAVYEQVIEAHAGGARQVPSRTGGRG
jgi:glycosyltransferase involved in cell wall biosynthesis